MITEGKSKLSGLESFLTISIILQTFAFVLS